MHAGVAYKIEATVVALATKRSSSCLRTWVRRSLHANVDEEEALRTWETWSGVVNLEFSQTSRTLSVVTSHYLRPFEKRLRGDVCGSGVCSIDIIIIDKLFRLGQVNFHIIIFSAFLGVIKFVD